MTLFLRNNCFKTGIIASFLSLIIVLAAAFTIFHVYPEVSYDSIRLSEGILQRFIVNFLDPDPYVPFATTAAAVLYSFVGIILIYYFFEKTQSPEILFIGLFIISFAFESIRLMVPLTKAIGLPSIYLVRSSRILIFSRYFGLFSLFISSVFTAGLKVQKQENIVLVTAAAALIFSLGVPTDGLSWDSTLRVQNDFNYILRMVEMGILLISLASFFISAYTRGSKQYIYIGLGAFLIYIGRDILLSGDTWASPVPGFLILSLGTWVSCAKLHRIYLWL